MQSIRSNEVLISCHNMDRSAKHFAKLDKPKKAT